MLTSNGIWKFYFLLFTTTMFVKASKRITMKNYSNKFKVEALWCNNRRLIICSSWSGVGPDQTLLKLQILILFFGGCFASDCYLLFPLKVTDIINGQQRIHTSTNYCSSLNIWKLFILVYDIINISSISIRPRLRG